MISLNSTWNWEEMHMINSGELVKSLSRHTTLVELFRISAEILCWLAGPFLTAGLPLWFLSLQDHENASGSAWFLGLLAFTWLLSLPVTAYKLINTQKGKVDPNVELLSRILVPQVLTALVVFWCSNCIYYKFYSPFLFVLGKIIGLIQAGLP